MRVLVRLLHITKVDLGYYVHSQCCGPERFWGGFRIHNFFGDSDTDPRTKILTRNLVKILPIIVFKFVLKIVWQKKFCYWKSRDFYLFQVNIDLQFFSIIFFNSARSESVSESELFSDPAKILRFFRIQIHNIVYSYRYVLTSFKQCCGSELIFSDSDSQIFFFGFRFGFGFGSKY
jgi:hypothetical protein